MTTRTTNQKFTMRLVVTMLLALTSIASAWADDSGNCGNTDGNVKWEYNAMTKTLKIYKNTVDPVGDDFDMKDYYTFGAEPWKNYLADISSVVIEEGVTRIGDYALSRLTALTSCTLPASVKTLGNHILNGCTSLETFIAPEGSQLETMGNNLFWECISLTKIVILAETPPTISSQTFADPSWAYCKIYVCNESYRTDTNWSHYNYGPMRVLYKVATDSGVSVVDEPHAIYGGATCYGEGITLTLSHDEMPGGYGFGGYKVTKTLDLSDVTESVLSGNETDGYTLTMPSYDITITANDPIKFPYTAISTAEEWDVFAASVLNGKTYSGEVVGLEADISTSTRVGSLFTNDGLPFSGTFDGKGHTLNVNIIDVNSEMWMAPFCFIQGATIKNLKVTGTVTSENFAAAGLVGYCAKNSTNQVIGCKIEANVNSHFNASGIVGYVFGGGLTLQDCYYSGTITNHAESDCAGLLARSDAQTLTIKDCLMKGTFALTQNSICHPIATYATTVPTTVNVSNALYLNTIPVTATNKQVIPGAEGWAVNTEYVMAQWDEPIIAADGMLYYGAHLPGKSLPYSYGFETTLDEEGWTLITNNPAETCIYENIDGSSSQTSYSGTKFFFFNYGPTQYLISPRLEGTTDLMVRLYYTLGQGISVGYSSTTTDIDAFTWVAIGNSNNLDWKEYITYVPAGTKYVALKANPGTTAKIDDIRISSYSSATITCSKEGYCTYYNSSNDAILPTTVKALIVTDNIDGMLTYETIADGDTPNNTVPAGTPVMLQTGRSSEAQQITLPLTPPMLAAITQTNLLQGSDYLTMTTGGGKHYHLSYDANETTYGWHWGNDNGTPFYSEAHRAWLVLPERITQRYFDAMPGYITLSNFADNTSTIESYNGQTHSVQIADRVLYKDDDWNTLCLPFDLELNGSPLDGATLMELDTEGTYDTNKHTGLDGSTLYLYFKAAENIEAGKPYIIKWKSGFNIEGPIFTNVTINSNASTEVTFTGGTFKGTYSPVVLTPNDKSILFLGDNNTLYWPDAANYSDGYYHLNAFRAYFELNDGSEAREIVLNFGEDNEVNGVNEVIASLGVNDDSWYTINGVKLSGKPTAKGLYIVNGHKVVVK